MLHFLKNLSSFKIDFSKYWYMDSREEEGGGGTDLKKCIYA